MKNDRSPQIVVFAKEPADLQGKPLGDPVMQLKKDFRRTSLGAFRFLRKWWRPVVASGAVLWTAGFFLLNPLDPVVVEGVQSVGGRDSEWTAGQLGKWGDFSRYNLILFVSLWFVAFFARSRLHQRLAVVVLLASVFAGATCNVGKYLSGRPRPHSEVPDRFYGVTAAINGWDFHSFPSGHTSTAFGASSAILASSGPYGMVVGSLATFFSGSISWARIYKDRHYPTDVLAGIWLGAVFGLATGMPYRRLRRRAQRRLAFRSSRVLAASDSTAAADSACEGAAEAQGSAEDSAASRGVATRSSTQLERATL